MKLVCAWCGVAIDSDTPGPDTSHGMCPPCSEALARQERGKSLQEYLNTIPIPILLIDRSDADVSMNANACEILGKKLNGTKTAFLGKVFDCLHSRSSEGCGRTIHCSGCAIRRSVTATFKTGDPQMLVPATLSIKNADLLSEAVVAVTTVKIGGLVLLRLE